MRLTQKANRIIEQPTIYLCYETSSEYKRLVYLGENLEDCIAQLQQEFDLDQSDCDILRNELHTVGLERDRELLIEEERLNCFSKNWN